MRAKAGVVPEAYSERETSEHTDLPRPTAAESQTIVETEQSVIRFETDEVAEDISVAAFAKAASSPSSETSTIAAAGFSATPDIETGGVLDISSADFEQLAERHTEAAYGDSNKYAELPPVNSAAKLTRAVEIEQISSSKIQPLGQLHESFIIAVDDEGLLLIDQHVAHERILFDKFRKSETERTIESQNLLLPETIDLSPAQSEAFQLIENDLESLGFGLMRLSGRTVAVKSIPTDLPASEIRNLLAEILDTIEAEKRGGAKTTFRDDIAASLACKAAVKINMKLTPEKMRWMIDRLLVTTSPTTCPHGRPVILRLSMKDIERGFQRT